MIRENGNISVHSENIFPIIKKWLYSEKDIFIRELVSNAHDAIHKLKRLVAMGEAQRQEEEPYRITVIVDKKHKTIQFIDNGIGMTADEVKKYINQVAFSGAKDFMEKYKDQVDEANQIIGHFGLGFYSAFMVSERVTIDTLSYREGAEAVRWSCAGGIEYEMEPSQRTQVGTTVTLYIAEDSTEFLEEYKVREVLNKYCGFLPVEIYLENAEADKSAQKADKEKEDQEKPAEPINDTHPLWIKTPSDCTEEEYKDFYKKVFFDFEDPLFWIHLNVDYPFNLKGILYFPKLKNEFESIEGRIKLYNNQVFVADNIKEVIPEFLLLLKGVIDCPDLPLNVSRSFLQNDGYVRKISNHIAKKVSDKLSELYKSHRDDYNRYWDDINPFVKYGCMRDIKFYEKVKDIIIYKTINNEYVTLKDYLDKNKDKHKNKVFYVTDEKQQAQYINLFKENGLDAVLLNTTIDAPFVQFMEMNEKDVKFNRIDSDLSESLKEADSDESVKDMQDQLEKLFKDTLKRDKLEVQVENLRTADVPAIILLAEQSRRMQEMSARFGNFNMGNPFPEEQTLVLNSRNDLIKSLLDLNGRKDREEDVQMICEHIFDLAMMGHKQLEPEEMTRFIQRSNQILTRFTEAGQGSK